MSDHWKRWRGYMDDVEDVLRAAAADLVAAERDAAREHGRHEWPHVQREVRLRELVRLGFDTPFLGDLLRAARRLDPESAAPRHDRTFEAWERADAGGPRSRRRDRSRPDAAERSAPPVDTRAVAPPPPGARPPRRLVRAESALAARTRSLVPVLEDLVVPRNASAVLRTVEALGLHEVHFVHRSGRLAVQSTVSKRAEAWLDLRQARAIDMVVGDLRARGYRILAADVDGSARSLEEVELAPRTAVIFGSEQRGVSERARGLVDGSVFVPVAGLTTYLNVSVAVALILHALDRRLRAHGWRAPLDRDDAHRWRAQWYRALASGNREREARYLRWLHRPPVALVPTHPRTRPTARDPFAAEASHHE